MAKINLEVDDKNLSTIMTILKNLKIGLIKDIKIDSKGKSKQKIQRKVLEDEFLPKTVSTSKYLSPEEFKKRLKGKK